MEWDLLRLRDLPFMWSREPELPVGIGPVLGPWLLAVTVVKE